MYTLQTHALAPADLKSPNEATALTDMFGLNQNTTDQNQ